jgi:hypothetical protein
MEYGTGAIFGCPGHDQRDLDFARKYGLGVTPVVLPPGEDPAAHAIGDTAYTGDARSSTPASSTAPDRRSEARGDQGAGGAVRRRRCGELAPARLGRVAPAVLGLPDPGDPLRGVRRAAGAADQLPVRTT